MSESDEYQICPYCAEKIKLGALKCKHCHSTLESEPSPAINGSVRNDGYKIDVASENNNDNNFKDNQPACHPLPNAIRKDIHSHVHAENVNNNKSSDPQEMNLLTTIIEKERKERIARMKSIKDACTTLYVICYLICAVFFGMGFYKMFAYNNPETVRYSDQPVNAYVGGDAYNYIINANYATAYFVLAIFCAVIGLTFVLCCFYYTNEIKREVSKAD